MAALNAVRKAFEWSMNFAVQFEVSKKDYKKYQDFLSITVV